MRPLLLPLLLLLAPLARAQIGPPADPTAAEINDLVGTMSAAKRVKGLEWDGGLHDHRAMIPVHCAASGAPSGYTMHYGWYSPDGDVTFVPADSASPVAKVAGPARATIRCRLRATKADDPVVHVGEATFATVGYGVLDTMAVAAIGGPITTSVHNPSTLGTERTYEHDENDPAKPFYLTNFGYAHNAAGTTSHLAQRTQQGTLTIPAQLSGTTVACTLPEHVFTKKPLTAAFDGTHSPTEIDVAAQAAFLDGVPKVKYSYNNGDRDDRLVGEADDDSDETKDRVVTGTQANPVVSWVAHVYHVSGHKPADMLYGIPEGVTDVPPLTQGDLPDMTGQAAWTDWKKYKYSVQDTTHQPMCGVWVQERFTQLIPPNFDTNIAGQEWTSIQ